MKASAIGAEDLMHATLVRRPFNHPDWAFENKLDGFRGLARRERGHVELLSRTGRSIGVCFPEIASALKRVPGEWVLDGELVVPDDRGHPSFELVRRRGVMTRPKSISTAALATPGAFCVFDVLFVGETDVRTLLLVRRKELLGEPIGQRVLAGGTRDLAVQLVPWLEAHGEALFAQACEVDLEGIELLRPASQSPLRYSCSFRYLPPISQDTTYCATASRRCSSV